MKLVSIELSQVSLLANIVVTGGSLYLPEAVKALQERFKFLTVPTTLEETRDPSGAVFSHGKFRDFVIDEMKVFTNGILVKSKSNIENTEAFLDNLLLWAAETFNAHVSDSTPVQRAYDSHVVAQSEIDLKRHFNIFDSMCQLIDSRLEMYEGTPVAYIPTGFTLHTDTYERTGLKPPAFTLERRANVPYESNLYYSTAPLKTADHLELLTDIERLLS